MRKLWLILALVVPVSAFAQSGLIFSEYIEGSSNNKALEIFNTTPSAINASNYRVQMYFNGSSSPGLTITLAGSVAPGDVFVLAHSAADPLILAQGNQFNGAGWFNGDDAITLVHVPTNTIIDSIGQIGFDPGTEWGTGLVSTADNTLRRKSTIPTGDTNPFNVFDPSAEWDGFATNTFDGLGSHGIVIPPPPVSVREIHEIQGSGDVSPLVGQVVQTPDNIVTAVGPTGFFIQTPDYRVDNNVATSQGIFVFTSNAPTVQVGQQVDVKGTVTEFFGMTELTGPLTIAVDASNMPLPAYFVMPAGFSTFERLEGTLVRVTNGVAADGTDQFNETMIVAGSSRPFRAPGVNGGDHPEIFDVDPTELGGAAQQIVGGATIQLAEGPFAYWFNDYGIWTTTLQFTNPAYPRPVRARNAGELTVGAQNMLRFLDNDPRLSRVSNHIRNVLGSPDVLAVSEVMSLDALTDLAEQLNFDDASLGYTAHLIEGHDIGCIDVGFLVRDSVSVSGAVAQLGANDTWIDPDTNAPALLNDRPPLLLRGSYINNGSPYPFAVIAVHQRSLIDVETSARVRAKRQAQAQALASYVQTLQTAEPGLRLVVTGDFNAFEFNDGYVDVMNIVTSGANLTNQVLTVSAGDRYSYIENGVAQVLDHSLTSAPLNPYVRDFDFARANADAPFASSPASDHEGLVLFVMTDADGDGLADDNDQCATGDARPTVILGGCDSGAPNLAMTGGCTLADQINALRASAKSKGQFMADLAKLLTTLTKNGQLTGAQRGAIEACAGQWK